MRIATDLGARDQSNIEIGADYAEGAAWLVGALGNLGRNEEARVAGIDALSVAGKVLEQRPGYRLALHAQQIIETDLANTATNDLNPAEALKYAKLGEQTSESLLKLDPGNKVSANNMGVAHQGLGDVLWAMGRIHEAIPYYLKSLDDYGSAVSGGAGFVIIHGYDTAQTSVHQAQAGDAAGAAATIAAGEPYLENLRRSEPAGSIAVIIVDALQKLPTAGVAFEADDLKGALKLVGPPIDVLEATKPDGGQQESQKQISLFVAYHLKGRIEYLLGDYPAAELAERASLKARSQSPTEAVSDHRDVVELTTWLAMAVAAQGRTAEARQLLAPALKFHRDLAPKNRGDQWQYVELASALYAQSLADKEHSAALLREAATRLDAVPEAMKAMHDVRLWRNLVSTAERGTAERGGQ
jgi:tetratricopeptide (TPR) repeat protein